MKNSKKILITTASSEIFILRRGRQKAARGFCEICQAETEMLDLDLAVTVFNLRMRELIRHIETCVVHSTETTGGHLLVCAASCEALMRKKK